MKNTANIWHSHLRKGQKYYYLYIENQCDIVNIHVEKIPYTKDLTSHQYPNLSNYIYATRRNSVQRLKRRLTQNLKNWFHLINCPNTKPKNQDTFSWVTTDSRCHIKTIHSKTGTGNYYPYNYYVTKQDADKMADRIKLFMQQKGIYK